MSKGVNFLMKKNKIKIFEGFGQLVPDKIIKISDKNGSETKIEGDKIIIATGARSKELPFLKKDGKKIIGYREAMTLEKQPKNIVIVGSGAIGIEFAYFYNSMGTSVTIVEYMDRIVPVEDSEISKELEKSLKKKGIKTALVSGGFTFFTERLKQQFGLDYTLANVLAEHDGKLTGEIDGPICGAEAKADFLLKQCVALTISPSQVIAMGDGANDLLMMKEAGLSIAYHAKPKVQSQAQTVLNYCGLEGVLGMLQ